MSCKHISNALIFPAAILSISLLSTVICAQLLPGDLDPTFSGDGKLTDGVLSHDGDNAYGVAVQADGKIVVAGWSWTGNLNTDFTVARYNTDGSLDTTFGTNGKVTTDFNGSYDSARSVAIQFDGKIVVGGSSSNGTIWQFSLTRYNSDGSLDATFDGDGKVTTPIGTTSAYISSIAIHTDGKIVAVGVGIAVARYNGDGSLDTSFDGDGKVVGNPLGAVANSVAIQPDGKIVIAGSAFSASALVRYNVNGSLDTSFSSDGVVLTSNMVVSSVAIQTDGEIVAAGSRGNAFALARYNSNGSLDSTFDLDGVVTTTIGSGAGANSVAIQPDGKIVAAGNSYVPTPALTDTDLAVARYNSNGSLDTTFDGDGIVTTPVNQGESQINSVALQPDGRIVGAGSTSPWFDNGSGSGSHRNDFILARYNDNGSLDTTFDGDGFVITDFPFFANNALHDVAIQPDGKIVTAGEAGYRFAVARYNPDGSRDSTFGGTGLVQETFQSQANAVAIQSDGNIVTAGAFQDDDYVYKFMLTRYHPNGLRDTSFGEDGIVKTPSTSHDILQSLVIQPDGKIVAAGSAGNNFAVVRYNPNGSLDTSFDGDGIVTTPVGSNASANAVAIQSDGKIVVAGPSTPANGSDLDFVLARYSMNGSLDTSFDGDGIVTTNIVSDDNAQDVVIQSDGKIVVGGCASFLYDFPCNVFALARYTTNGSLDTTFDSDGKVTTSFVGGFPEVYLNSVAIRPDGKIVAAGYSESGANNDFALALYNVDGSLDTTFGGGDGKTTADFNNSNDQAYGMDIDNAGRAVVVGESNGRFAIARFILGPSGNSATPFDYDGDGSADLSVFRPGSGDWWMMNPQTGVSSAANWGVGTDRIAPADYDGDGKTDIAVYRPSEGTWWVMNSLTSTFSVQAWGDANDVIVPGDYTGDGKADHAVWRPSDGNWWIRDISNGQVQVINWGISTDKPVPADYDGNGTFDIMVFRPSEGSWYLRLPGGGTTVTNWGTATDKLVPADYTGDGSADLAVWRPSSAVWWILDRSSGQYQAIHWGDAADLPVPADYDGNGETNIAVWRPADGVWWILNDTGGGFTTTPWGTNGDIPTPNAFVR